MIRLFEGAHRNTLYSQKTGRKTRSPGEVLCTCDRCTARRHVLHCDDQQVLGRDGKKKTEKAQKHGPRHEPYSTGA